MSLENAPRARFLGMQSPGGFSAQLANRPRPIVRVAEKRATPRKGAVTYGDFAFGDRQIYQGGQARYVVAKSATPYYGHTRNTGAKQVAYWVAFANRMGCRVFESLTRRR